MVLQLQYTVCNLKGYIEMRLIYLNNGVKLLNSGLVIMITARHFPSSRHAHTCTENTSQCVPPSALANHVQRKCPNSPAFLPQTEQQAGISNFGLCLAWHTHTPKQKCFVCLPCIFLFLHLHVHIIKTLSLSQQDGIWRLKLLPRKESDCWCSR